MRMLFWVCEEWLWGGTVRSDCEEWLWGMTVRSERPRGEQKRKRPVFYFSLSFDTDVPSAMPCLPLIHFSSASGVLMIWSLPYMSTRLRSRLENATIMRLNRLLPSMQNQRQVDKDKSSPDSSVALGGRVLLFARRWVPSHSSRNNSGLRWKYLTARAAFASVEGKTKPGISAQ